MTKQRGNIIIGLILGMVLGLGVALGVAVYVTKVPVPFMNKTQHGGVEQDAAEALKNRDWDPNAPLAGKNPSRPVAPVPVVVVPKPSAATSAAAAARAVDLVVMPAEVKPDSIDPLGDLARSRVAKADAKADKATTTPPNDDPFLYFVQAGAFRTTEDAESQRAKLSLMGVPARVTEREQSGRTVFRVRAGPFDKKDEADRLKDRLDNGGLESALVRVQR